MTHLQIRTRPAMEFDAVPVVMMAHDFAHHCGDRSTLKLHGFMRDACGDFPRCHVLLVEDHDSEIGGFAAGHFTYRFHTGCAGFEIRNLFIRPECRRRGMGRALVKDMVRFAVSRDCNHISLAIPATGEEAISFCRRMGFEQAEPGGNTQSFCLEGRKLKEFMEKKQ